MAKLVWLAFMAALCVVAVGQPASPSEHCISVLMDMSDCLSFVENGSSVARPSTFCCDGFKKVLKSNPQCLCDAFFNQKSFPIPIDMKKAMFLPTACKATGSVPCTISGANGPSPAPSPSRSIPTPAPKKSPPSHSPAPEQPNPPATDPAMVPASSPSTSEDVRTPAPVPEQSAASVLPASSSVALILAVLALVGSPF